MAKKSSPGSGTSAISGMVAQATGNISSQDFSGSVVVHKNLDQSVIIVSEDKLRLCLISHREVLASKLSWLAPLSLLLSFVTTLSTAEFHETMKISADTWRALFIFATVGATGWLVFDLARLIINWKKGDTNKFIEQLKNLTNS
ncbi:hypothetical protein BDW_04925 [Bdellovibrio bacteriovorus W]|nr:hypothetical protein BDW_04925 [Bdellovibrio bacteriovorus W]